MNSTKLVIPEGYRELTLDTLSSFVANDEKSAKILGGTSNDWQFEEVSDGNLNQVFIARGPQGSLAIKQSLPYLRLVGESWPLPLERADFENLALNSQSTYAPNLVPKIINYDKKLYCNVLEYLKDHIIMRQGMIDGVVYPRFVEDISAFLANNLFFTSDLHLGSVAKRELIHQFSRNQSLCKITEDVIFNEPYIQADNNRWTTPYLDNYAKRYREDVDLKIGIARLKNKYLASPQALLHGDLHTGSVMLTKDSTKVIDAEFACCGPMGFDVGKIIANLLINYFSQPGHATKPKQRDAYQQWILECVVGIWSKFEAKFLNHWCDSSKAIGDGFTKVVFNDKESQDRLELERAIYMNDVLQDSLGFCGAFITRRILGIAHNIDLEEIKDDKTRAMCEARALDLAIKLITKDDQVKTINDLVKTAKSLNENNPTLS